jgi:uncharacterized protein YbjT (DUF2867 family)
MNTHRPILVAGATGYVGGRLIPALLQSGMQMIARCLRTIAQTQAHGQT